MRRVQRSTGSRSSDATCDGGRCPVRRRGAAVVLAVVVSGCGSAHHASKARVLAAPDQNAADNRACPPRETTRRPVARLVLGKNKPYPHLRMHQGQVIEVEVNQASSGARYTLPYGVPRGDVCLISSQRQHGMVLASFRATHTGTVTFVAASVVPPGDGSMLLMGRAHITRATQ